MVAGRSPRVLAETDIPGAPDALQAKRAVALAPAGQPGARYTPRAALSGWLGSSLRRGSWSSARGTRSSSSLPRRGELLASIRSDRPAYTDDAIAPPVLALTSFIRGKPEGGHAGSNVVTVPGSAISARERSRGRFDRV
jgi:hypothetical protein